MQCPTCGYIEMREQTYEETVSHGGECIRLPEMKGQVCPKCGEVVWDDISYARFFKAQDALIIKARNSRRQPLLTGACAAMALTADSAFPDK